jgi:hypothetical protein
MQLYQVLQRGAIGRYCLPSRPQDAPVNPDFRSWLKRSCDAPSQKGVGDALVASCGGDDAAAGKNATGRRRYFRQTASEFGLIHG